MAGVAYLIRALQLLIILAITAFFAFNLHNNIKNLNVKTQSFEIMTNNSLVPPAITLCLTVPANYSFSISIYGEVIAEGDNSEYLDTYRSDDEELEELKGIVDTCWILASPNKEPIILSRPPTSNVPDMNLTYTRFVTSRTSTPPPILINIFDPLAHSTNFKYNRFLRLDPDVNRAVAFSRIESEDLNNKITSDVLYNIIDEYRDPSNTGDDSATSSILIRPITFDISRTKDVVNVTWLTIIVNSFTLIGVLIGSVYIPLVGSGKFRPWGYLNILFQHYPVKNISKIAEEGRILKEEKDGVKPDISDILRVYLDRVEIAQYK